MGIPALNRPSNIELRRLYIDERLSAEKIAKRCDVQKITVLRWLKAAGVERRPTSNGLANRGIVAPTADELHNLVHVEHLSYEAIAERYGVDPTAVPYWLRKCGIERPGIWDTRYGEARPTLPSADELRARMSAGHSLVRIGADHGVSSGPIRRLCDEYGIEVRADGWNGGLRHDCIDGHQVRSTYEQRVDNWLTEHGIEHEYEPRYPWDRRYRADYRVGDTYVEIWGVSNDEAYDQRKAMKVAKCKATGVDLIEINYWQFSRGTWARRLKRLDQPVGDLTQSLF